LKQTAGVMKKVTTLLYSKIMFSSSITSITC